MKKKDQAILPFSIQVFLMLMGFLIGFAISPIFLYFSIEIFFIIAIATILVLMYIQWTKRDLLIEWLGLPDKENKE